MRIAGWDIDGFGLFTGYRVDDLPAGLTLIHGPNEAGKSTLLGFVRGVLFGFPDGRSKDRRFASLGGRRLGGRLFVEDDAGGRWIVERLASPGQLTITSPSGSLGTQSDLDALVGHADRELFRNIFAFSLAELDSFAALEERSVSERIFASAAIGAGRSPGAALKDLGKLRESLYKPRGTAEINELRKKLKDVRLAVREAQRVARDYPEAVARERDAEELFRSVDSKWEEAHADLRRVRLLIDLWADWSEIVRAESELGELTVPDGVTERSEIHLNELTEKISAAGASLAERQADLDRLAERRGRVTVDDRLPPISSEVVEAYGALSGFESELAQRDEIRASAAQARKALGKILDDLGPGWDPQRIESFDRSIATHEVVRGWGVRLQDAARRVEELRSTQARLAEEIESARSDFRGKREELVAFDEKWPGLPGADELDRLERAGVHLRARLADLNAREAQVDAARGVFEDREAAARQRTHGEGPERWVLIGVAAALVISAIAAAGSRVWIAAAVAAAAAVVVGLLGFRALLATGLSGEAVPGSGDGSPEDSLVERARRSYGERVTEAEAIGGEVASLASALRLPPRPASIEVEEALDQVLRGRAARDSADRLATEAAHAREALDSIEKKVASAKEELDRALEDRSSLDGEWVRWRSDRGIPEGGSPAVVEEVFGAVDQARQTLSMIHEHQTKLVRLDRRAEEFHARAARIFRAVGQVVDVEGNSLRGELSRLHEKVGDDRRTRENLANIDRGIEGASANLDEANRQLAVLQEDLQSLLDATGTGSADELREAVKRWRRREELLAVVDKGNLRIDKRIGEGDEARRMRDEVTCGDVTGWEQRRDRLIADTESFKATRDAALETLNSARMERRRVEESSDIATLSIEEQALRSALEESVERFTEVALAEALIEETIARFEAKHQPAVVSRAGKLFERVTAGHYRSVHAGEKNLAVVDSASRRVDVVDLSTGAAQQLYLCVRIGLAEELAHKGASLPLVMDEVLVSFDPERADEVAGMIAEVAGQRQVIMLTCHPETVERMATACPQARVVRLGRFLGGEVPSPGGAS